MTSQTLRHQRDVNGVALYCVVSSGGKCTLSAVCLTTVPAESFRTLSKLVVLDLSHNHINRLETRCFVGLTQLRTLNLHGNDMDLVRLSKRTFAGLPSYAVRER